jgi:signal transduction histidine kinase
VPPERLDGALENIDAASNRMTALVDSLLDLAHLQMGQPLELQREPTDLVGLVAEVAAECQQTTDRHEIRLNAIPALYGEWDGQRLQRVIGNLLDNAVKYSPDGGSIEVTVARDGGATPTAVLTVQDHGMGIPAADLPRIFDRFRRGSNVVGKVGGTGIGLASARQIVEQHGGTISVSSDVGEGTLITIRLPLTSPAEDGGESAGGAVN